MTVEEIRTLDAEGVGMRLDAIRTEMNAEDADIEALTAEVDALEKRGAEIRKTAKNRAELEERLAGTATPAAAEFKAETEERKMPTLEEVRKSHEYNVAYAEYLKTGDAKEVRALLTNLVSDGTVPVAEMVSDAIATAWEQTQLVSRINKIQVNGSYTAVFELSATGASVHVEGTAAPAEETITFGQVKIEPEYVKKWIRVSDKVLSLKGEAFLNYLNQEISYQINKLLDDTVISAIKACPAESTATAAAVPTATAAKPEDAVIAGLAVLADQATNPVAIMTKDTFYNKIVLAKGTDGQPIYNVIHDNGKTVIANYGVEVLFNSTVGADTVIVGDLSGALAVVPNGNAVEFVTDPYSLAEQNLVKIVGKELIGIGIVRPKFFAKVTIGATA